MPCRNDTEDEDRARARFELDKITRLLCEATRHMSDKDMPLSAEHLRWWRLHQDADRQRRERAVQRIAELRKEISKLTAELD